MSTTVRIGTRESELAVFQAKSVQSLLLQQGINAELVFIKSEGDVDLVTPLYEIGVQGIFTRALDIALLNNKIDLAVHSYKDVPTQLPAGIAKAAILKRTSYKDILVFKDGIEFLNERNSFAVIATSSIRRKAQWLHRYPGHQLENLRGNVNTRLRKLQDSDWQGAIFAAAGLERINLRPKNSLDLDWMLPAPAQGAIAVVCRETDEKIKEICEAINHPETDIATKTERDFLRTLLGGCSTPISALAEINNGQIHFKGNILSPDGKNLIEIEKSSVLKLGSDIGKLAGQEVLEKLGKTAKEWFEN
ncbi:MAG: hydroxymethylbilane synthase [Bacteroidetes bacterium]|nr:MAG: hydroxymethylbilane synthase [Bacteroidota bacterium]